MKKQTLSFEELFAIVKRKISTKEKGSYSHTIGAQGIELDEILQEFASKNNKNLNK
jgi:phosphoribosyl-ATP pyrophosphohydrolase